jgi:hypothetical protein
MRIKTASTMLLGLLLCGCADQPDTSPAAPAAAASTGPSATGPSATADAAHTAPSQQSSFPPAAAGLTSNDNDSWFTVGRGAATGAGVIAFTAAALAGL